MDLRPIIPGALGMLAAFSLVPGAASADEPGKLAFNNHCRTCHTVREGDNRLGPSLYGVVGRQAGTLSGFVFSEDMRQSRIIWDAASLDRFIANPDEAVPGNRMKPYGGMRDAQERAAIIAYLQSVSPGTR